MQQRRLAVRFGIYGMLALAGTVALLNPRLASADEGSNGGSYVTTVKDANGNFSSRGVITLHADHTMSVIDSGQGGPAFLFSSQLGAWKPDGKGGVVAKTIDFDFPSVDVARVDYTIKFNSTGTQITGTITLTVFPLQGNPLDGGGTVVGTFTFTGQLI
jgi:hypothetical protein